MRSQELETINVEEFAEEFCYRIRAEKWDGNNHQNNFIVIIIIENQTIACLSVDETEKIEGTIGDIWEETTSELTSLNEEWI